jgi:hypothetical protein
LGRVRRRDEPTLRHHEPGQGTGPRRLTARHPASLSGISIRSGTWSPANPPGTSGAPPRTDPMSGKPASPRGPGEIENPPPQQLGARRLHAPSLRGELNFRSPTLQNFEASWRSGIKSLTTSLYSCYVPAIVSSPKGTHPKDTHPKGTHHDRNHHPGPDPRPRPRHP